MSSPNYTDAELAQATRDVLDAAIGVGGHDLALSALLGAYATVAKAHSCCTSKCSQMCFQLSMILAAEAAGQRPANSPVH